MIEISRKNLMDLFQITAGGYEPIHKFMGSGDIESVLKYSMLDTGETWTIPITLNVPEIPYIRAGETVCLHYSGSHVADMEVEEILHIDKGVYVLAIYATDSPDHPGVMDTMRESAKCITGKISRIKFPDFLNMNPDPHETKRIFRELGWRTIAAFQTRNPPHRAHEFMQRRAMETVDGLFINPVTGDLKNDDFSGTEIMKAYSYFISKYYPRWKVFLSPLMIAMRYAGPRAAVFLAQIRKNYGCTHFIVGRDMAGVGKYYDPYAAQKAIEEAGIGIELIKFQEVFFCRMCSETVDSRSCAHDEIYRTVLSMSSIRNSLKLGMFPPKQIMRRDVAEKLIEELATQKNSDILSGQVEKAL